MKQLRIVLVAMIAICCTTSAQAHPGHGTSGSAHYLTEPEHLVALGIAGLLVTMLCIGKFVMNPAGRKSST